MFDVNKYKRLCKLMGEDNIPMAYLCDDFAGYDSPHLSPFLLEKYLKKFKFISVGENESIKDVIAKHYGEEAVGLIYDLM